MSHHFIRVSHVSYPYPSGTKALDDVSFLITHGEKVALLGANGAGKSTLLLHTNGLLLAQEGEVNVGDVPVTRKTLPLVRQSVGLVFQNPDDQLFMPTVEEDVAFGAANMRLPDAEIGRRVEVALDRVGALDLRRRAPSELSGGQKRRVAIATVLSMEPSILVLDEPTSNLDWKAQAGLMDLLREFDHTCLIATHDLELIREVCRRCLVLDGGRLVADVTPEELLADGALRALLGLGRRAPRVKS